jgi:L-rhamnose mutarotase
LIFFFARLPLTRRFVWCVVVHSNHLNCLFSTFDYVGDNFEADMAAIAADPVTQRWWKLCEPLQEPLVWSGPPPSAGGRGGDGGEWWATLEEFFHTE